MKQLSWSNKVGKLKFRRILSYFIIMLLVTIYTNIVLVCNLLCGYFFGLLMMQKELNDIYARQIDYQIEEQSVVKQIWNYYAYGNSNYIFMNSIFIILLLTCCYYGNKWFQIYSSLCFQLNIRQMLHILI